MYGYDVQPRNDPFVRLTDVGNDIIIKTVQNGVYLVDVFPIREFYMHRWFKS